MTSRPVLVQWGRVGPPYWEGRQLFVVGGGPSLAGYDLGRLREHGWVLGVNRTADYWPVDAVFTIDYQFLRRRAADLAGWAARGIETYAAVADDYDRPPIPGVTYLKRVSMDGISLDPSVIANGLNSGFGGLNLAVLKLARRIILLGFDLQPVAKDQPTHWHSGYDWGGARASVSHYERWASRFRQAVSMIPPGVEVLNANPDSAIRAFPFTTYEAIGLRRTGDRPAATGALGAP